jgi:hypothetical protein
MTAAHSITPCRTEAEVKQFRRLYMASFAIFLVFALVARLLPRHWRLALQLGPVGSRSILNEAHVAANTYVPFAFMG